MQVILILIILFTSIYYTIFIAYQYTRPLKRECFDSNIIGSCPIRQNLTLSPCTTLINAACDDSTYASLKNEMIGLTKNNFVSFDDASLKRDPNKSYCFAKSLIDPDMNTHSNVPLCNTNDNFYNIPGVITNVYPGTVTVDGMDYTHKACIMEFNASNMTSSAANTIALNLDHINNSLYTNLETQIINNQILANTNQALVTNTQTIQNMAQDCAQNLLTVTNQVNTLTLQSDQATARYYCLLSGCIILYNTNATTAIDRFIVLKPYNTVLYLNNIFAGISLNGIYMPPAKKDNQNKRVNFSLTVTFVNSNDVSKFVNQSFTNVLSIESLQNNAFHDNMTADTKNIQTLQVTSDVPFVAPLNFIN